MIQSRVCTQSQQLPGSKPEWSWHHTASCVVHSVMVAPEILSYWSPSSDIFVHVRKKKKINVGKNMWWLLSCRMAQTTSWLILASRSRLWMLYWYNSRCFWHRLFFVWLRTRNTRGSCCLKLVKTWKNLLQLLLSLNSWIVFIYHYTCKKISSFWSIVKCMYRYSRICTSLGCNSS